LKGKKALQIQKRIFLFILFSLASLLLPLTLAHAALRTELIDEDKDGRKETKVFYNDSQKLRTEVDVNGDGKPDKFIEYKNGKRHLATADIHFDGKIDSWSYFDEAGVLKNSARDLNHDGKPDSFSEFLKGRNLVLKEFDRNFDGKIDRRSLVQWDPNKGVNVYNGGRVQRIPTPGYTTLWSEEDNDFDGKIDVYKERGNKNPPTEKIGKSIASRKTSL